MRNAGDSAEGDAKETFAMIAFTVTCEWDEEASVWYVSESNVPGLTGEASDLPHMESLLLARIPELLRLNKPELFTDDSPLHVPLDLVIGRHHRELNLACA